MHLNKREELAEEVLEEGVTRFRRRFPKQQVTVTVPEEILLVPMDAMLIEQVLINLLEKCSAPFRCAGACGIGSLAGKGIGAGFLCAITV